jgi:uncharacterized ferritin-like protein (DUF455 family)
VRTLREIALDLLVDDDALSKAARTLEADDHLPVRVHDRLKEPAGVPGRPYLPKLVSHTELKPRPVNTLEGRAMLVHSIAHIEMNAVNLALDVCWRFADMPEKFYRDWFAIAKEEAQHFTLLRNHLVGMGFDYGSFDAHNSLWAMAERTKDDILARIALVPRTLEARGLDASPAVKRKLVGAGDHRAGDILDIILRDEIGHVACGNYWFRWLCGQRQLEPVGTYEEMSKKYNAPRLRAPFNIEARKLAGFDNAELDALVRTSKGPR